MTGGRHPRRAGIAPRLGTALLLSALRWVGSLPMAEAPTILYAAIFGVGVFKSADGGQTWQLTTSFSNLRPGVNGGTP